MEKNASNKPQNQLRKRSRRPKSAAGGRDFFRVAAALANPDFVDLCSADRQAIRQVLTTPKTNKGQEI